MIIKRSGKADIFLYITKIRSRHHKKVQLVEDFKLVWDRYSQKG